MVSFSEVKDTVKEKVEVAKEKVSDVVVSKLSFGFLQHLISEYVVEHNQSNLILNHRFVFIGIKWKEVEEKETHRRGSATVSSSRKKSTIRDTICFLFFLGSKNSLFFFPVIFLYIRFLVCLLLYFRYCVNVN